MPRENIRLEILEQSIIEAGINNSLDLYGDCCPAFGCTAFVCGKYTFGEFKS